MSGSKISASGEGVQVLFVEEDGRYRCDEAALRRVAGGGAARGLPVAVVSVAGATRGGKSFLLDFFLRYLRAPVAARRSAAWLGADDEPLTGFSWRGGCERHTEGIFIWSEPIIVTLGPEENNEKVAVLLLDTQGSFDSSSTMRDSSTVFALSTLLSSVQIFNLSQNIKEDDLQYLQLFTEYGRLAREEGAEQPFQELRFLVRDWSFAYDHPVGAEGGQQLLDKRLEIRDSQASELREVRTHVRGAFQRVRGFLLPHPGLTVATSPAFSGCLKDISAEFKDALLELVPSLFDPNNLTIKHINGQMMTLQDFAEYFKTYVEIFNSDILPTPTTVMQATSVASLEAALSACRAEYSAGMSRGARGAACVPRGVLPRLHAAALLAARQTFAARRTFAAPELAAARLDAVLQELDASLADYVAMNSGRILEAAARSKALYEAAMQADECLADDELTARHNAAVAAARKAFYAEFTARMETASREDDDNRSEKSEKCEENSEVHADNVEEHSNDSEGPEDGREEFEDDNEDWKTLEKELEELLPLHRERNAARAAAAQAAARELYTGRVREATLSARCLHPHSLRSVHAAAAAAAADCLLAAWHDAANVPEEHKTNLNGYTAYKYQEFVATNNVNNDKVIEEAQNVYNDIMTGICNGDGFAPSYLHPRALFTAHERAERAAAAHFAERRDAAARHLPLDDHEFSFTKGLVELYLSFNKNNEERNKAAVKDAHEYYLSRISPVRGGGEGVLDFFGPPDMDVFTRHPRVKEEAISHFMSNRRRSDTIYLPDDYVDDLKKKIEESWTWIQVKFTANIATTGLGAAAMVAVMFLTKR